MFDVWNPHLSTQTIETITATKLRQEQQLAMAFDNRELRTWSGSSIFGYLEKP